MGFRNLFNDEKHAREDSFEQFFDFFTYNAADWTLTTVEAGAGSATEATGAGAGGLLVVTNDAADDDKDFFQGQEAFKFIVGKALQFTTRFKVNSATQCDIFAGLYITDTDPVGGLSDGIYFRKDDGDTHIDFIVIKNGTATTVSDVAELVDDTFIKLEFYYDGVSDHIQIYVDNSGVGRAELTNAPDDEEIALSFGIQNGEAVAKVLTVDYIGARQVR